MESEEIVAERVAFLQQYPPPEADVCLTRCLLHFALSHTTGAAKALWRISARRCLVQWDCELDRDHANMVEQALDDKLCARG